MRLGTDGALSREGHGPFPLDPGATGRHTWIEPADGGERVAVTWSVTLPAEVTATVALSEEMVADVSQDGAALGRVLPGRPWSGTAGPGDLTVEARSARKSNGLPYTVTVQTAELVPGQQRTVGTPAELPLAVGRDGWVAVASRGSTDVRLRLYDSDGALVAANDDRPDDWNARLSARLTPGRYRVVVDSLDGTRGRTRIWVSDQAERSESELRSGTERVLVPGDDAVLLPLDPRRRELVRVQATSDEGIGAAVEVQTAHGWRALQTATGRQLELAVRLREGGGAVRVRLWSEDRRGSPVRLTAWTLGARRVGESVLSSGAESFAKPHGAVRLPGRRAGLFSVADNRADVWVCARPAAACERAGSTIVGASEAGLILLGSAARLMAQRVSVDDAPVNARLDKVLTIDVDAQSGPSVLVVRTPGGQPGASFGAVLGPAGMAVSERAAIAAQLGGQGRARVWDASNQDRPLDARLSHHPLRSADPISTQPGRTELAVPPGAAQPLQLPLGVSDLDLALDTGLVAITGDDRVTWAADGPRGAALDGVEGELWLLNPTDREALVTLDLFPDRERPLPLDPEHPLEHVQRVAGWQVRSVAPSPGTLFVRGAVDTASYLRADGQVLTGGAMEIGPGGTLWLGGGPGARLAWMSSPEHPGPHLDTTPRPSVALGTGGRVTLSGDQMSLAIDLGAPGLVRLGAPCAFVAHTVVEGGTERVQVREAGGGIDLWLPAGRATVGLRALQGTPCGARPP